MIYFCIPTYNEEHTVGVVLWKLRQVMAEFPRDYQVLLIDDASTDRTPEVLEPYSRIMPLHIRRNETRLGYGACLEQMLEESLRRSSYLKRDCAIVLQADFTEEPADVTTLIRRIEGGADVVTAVAKVEGGHPTRSHGLVRGFASWLLGRLPFPENSGDPLLGMRAYRLISLRKGADDGLDLAGLDGPLANARVLQRVAPHARRLEEVEVTVRYDRRLRETRFRPVRRVGALVRFAFGRHRTGAAPADDQNQQQPQGAGA